MKFQIKLFEKTPLLIVSWIIEIENAEMLTEANYGKKDTSHSYWWDHFNE